jgi:signal transduction histidine kinase/DNA-binding NarL/FixJ family response regulator
MHTPANADARLDARPDARLDARFDATIELASRTERLRSIVRICVVGWSVFTLLNAAQTRWISASIDLAVTVGHGLVFALVRRRSLRATQIDLAANACALLSGVGLATVSLIQGQSLAMASWFLVAAPLYAAHLLGRRATWGWTFGAIALLAVVHLSSRVHTITPEFVHKDVEIFFGAAVLVVVVNAFATSAQRAYAASLASLAESNAIVRGQSEELVRARDAAMVAARAKGDFLAVMSHELRTPLNGVSGMAELLAETPLDAHQRSLVDTLFTSAQAKRVLVDDILDLSKIEAGRLTVEAAPFVVRNAIEDVAALLRPISTRKGLALETVVAEDVPQAIVGDAARVRQVLLNLVGNAVKFTDRGSVRVVVDRVVDRVDPRASSPHRGDERPLHIAVIDTGPGVAADRLASIFEPFEQADPSPTRRFEGTGLGLTICRRLCAAMGGGVWVESTVGVGSTFHATVEITAFDGRIASSPRARLPASVPPPNADARVLLVEDHAVNVQVARAFLERLGVAVDVARNGFEAIAAVAKYPYSAVLMDVRMPEMDGLEATRRILAERRDGPRPRIIAMTANAMWEDRRACLAAGMDDFVSKPIALDALIAALVRAGVPVRDRAPSPRLDPAVVESLRSLCEETGTSFSELLAEHRTSAGALCDAVARAVAAGDRSAVEHAAHTLRGSSATFGDRDVADLCATLERLARDLEKPAFDRDLARLLAAWEASERSFRALEERSPTSSSSSSMRRKSSPG